MTVARDLWRLAREVLSLRWFVKWADDVDERSRAGEFGKWPWQDEPGLWPWQRSRRP